MQMRGMTRGELLRVIDGDTLLCRVICPCCQVSSEQRVRLARIDAPELSGVHRGAGLDAKSHLTRLCTHRELWFVIQKAWPDRYGRVLAEVTCENVNLSDAMLRSGLARPYKQPTKSDPVTIII